MPNPFSFDPAPILGLATETVASLIGEAVSQSSSERRRIEASESDLTILMGLMGNAPYTFALEMDGESVVAFGEAMLRRCGGMDFKSLSAEEAPAILCGAIEEMTNRIVSKIAAKLEKDSGVPWSVTPPICIFGGNRSLGGALEGISTQLVTPSGKMILTLAPEGRDV